MQENEFKYYEKIGNWDFSQIKSKTEKLTNWDFYEKIKENTNEKSLCLDLGTGGGERVLKNYPDVGMIIATDYSEKMIKTAIKRGTDYSNPNNSEAIKMRDSVGAANLQDVTSLYNEYQTTLKDNVSAITDKETHDTLSNISEQTPQAFRNTVINSETLNNIRAFDENGTPGNYSASDAVKLNAAKVASVMNREGEAARKQQEGKK